MEFFQEMKSEQVQGQTTTYNFLVKGFLQKGELGSALQLVREMRDKRIRADVNTYLPLLTVKLGKKVAQWNVAKSGEEKTVEREGYNLI